MSSYILENAAEQARARFSSLEACFDPVTIRHLEEIGVAPGMVMSRGRWGRRFDRPPAG
jgi:hypothetical protein